MYKKDGQEMLGQQSQYSWCHNHNRKIAVVIIKILLWAQLDEKNAVPSWCHLIGSPRIVLMGGNYVFKAQPYFPPLDVVRSDAKAMAAGAKKMAYKPPPAADGSARCVLPCVRLGAMMEGAFPEKPGKTPTVDTSFAANLEATVKVFQEEANGKVVGIFVDEQI